MKVSVQALNKSVANSPVKPSAPEGPARMVLAVPDEPARGRLSVETVEAKRTSVRAAVRFQRQYGGSEGAEYKPVLRDELATVATIHRYPPERLRMKNCPGVLSTYPAPNKKNVNESGQSIKSSISIGDI